MSQKLITITMDEWFDLKQDKRRLEWLMDWIGTDAIIENKSINDFIDLYEWDRQGGNDCDETRRAFRAAIDAAAASGEHA